MAEIEKQVRTTESRESFTVLLIGFRVNHLFKPHRWWWIVTAFAQMATELETHRDYGLLHARTLVGARGVTVVQYWDSTEALLRYARESKHSQAWREFYRRRDGSAGIWHETYEIGAPQSENSRGFEAIYADMPRTGLGKALGTQPVTHETRRSRDRLRHQYRAEQRG